MKSFLQFIGIYLVASLLTSCSSKSFTDSNSNLVGQWNNFEHTEVPAHGEGLNFKPSQILTTDFTYFLEAQAKGHVVEKYVSTIDNQEDYVLSIDYPMEWSTGKNGSENFIALKWGEGKILDIEGQNKTSLEQERQIWIHNRIATFDTIYFAFQKDGAINCHWPRENEIWTMRKK